jgi:predicted PurR-regulated permease PerM
MSSPSQSHPAPPEGPSGLRSKIEQYLGVALLLLLLLGCFLVMLPFISALLWATILAFSLWPLYDRLVRWLRGRRTLAAALLSLGMVFAILLPVGIVGLTLGDNVKELKGATQRLLEAPPRAPAWLAKVPLVGNKATESWNALASDSTKLVERAQVLIEPIGTWLLYAGLKLSVGLVQLTLSILLTFFLLRQGTALGGTLKEAIHRIAGERGTHLLGLAGNTVRGVVYGILGTAIVQAVMAGVGFLVAGVPGAGLLALLTFFLSVVPMGPPIIWLPAALWLFHQGSTGWGIFMIIWGIGVSMVDNFVKPWLISQGSNMPFILTLFGVLGGAVAFGFIGVFIGPTLLAVGYRIVKEWSAPNSDPAGPPTAQQSEKLVSI